MTVSKAQRIKACFIANPNAGRGRVMRDWPVVEASLGKYFKNFKVSFTRKKGEGSALTEQALEKGTRLIVAVGGDGTLNECLNGFVKEDRPINTEAALGLLPLGRGSDLARFFKIPHQSNQALSYLFHTKARPFDVGKVTYTDFRGGKKSRYFLNIASVGICAHVDNWVNKTPGFLGAKLSYFYSTLRSLLEYSPQKVSYSFGEERHDRKLLMMIVANGGYFGSGMHVAPHARIDDGLFNVSVVRAMGLGKMVTELSTLYSGDYLKSEEVHSFSTHRLQVKPASGSHPLMIEMDGDTVGKIPATFELLPGLIRFRG